MDHNTVLIMEREALFKQQLEVSLTKLVGDVTHILARLDELDANVGKLNKGGKPKADQ